MPSLNEVLGSIPGVAGYEAARQQNDARLGSQLGNVSSLVQIQTALQQQQAQQRGLQRDTAMRDAIAALPPEQRTRENIMPILLQHGNVKDVVPLMTNENTVSGQKAMGLARLMQAKAMSDQNYAVSLRNATSREEANRIQAQKAIDDQNFNNEKLYWETGQRVPVQPIQVPQVTGQAQQPVQPQVQPAPAAQTIQPGPVPVARPAPAAPALPPRTEAAIAQDRARLTDTQILKGLEENYTKLRDVPQQLASMEKAKEQIPNARVFMGPLGEQKLWAVKFFKDTMGLSIDVANVSSAEELRARIFFNIMDNLKKMDAQPSQLQQKIMQDALGNLGTDPDALSKIIDAYSGVLRDKVTLYHKQVDEAGAYGITWPHRIDMGQDAGGIREFPNEAAAAKAGVKPGTRVRIGGRLGTWQ